MADIEQELYGDGDSVSRTKRIFEMAGPRAAWKIVDLAENGSTDHIKLRASQYVVDRILGPVGRDENQDVLHEFLEGIEKIANGQDI